MQPLRETEAACNTEPERRANANPRADQNRNPASRRSDQTRDPADDPKAEDERRQLEPAGLRNPGSRRRNTKGQTKKKMCGISEAFRERVEKNNQKCGRREQKVSAVDGGGSENETDASKGPAE